MDLSSTLNMFVKSAENFQEAFEKKNQLKKKNEHESKFKMGLEYFDNLQFFDLKLFSNASRNFSADFTNMFKLLERSA